MVDICQQYDLGNSRRAASPFETFALGTFRPTTENRAYSSIVIQKRTLCHQKRFFSAAAIQKAPICHSGSRVSGYPTLGHLFRTAGRSFGPGI